MIRIKKDWYGVDTFSADVINPRGEKIFHSNGRPWKMVLRAPTSDEIKKVMSQNQEETERWRARLPESEQATATPPEEMQLKHGKLLCQVAHVAWLNAPLEEKTDEKDKKVKEPSDPEDADINAQVDFMSEDFVLFLEEEPWYIGQWRRAWVDKKNSFPLKSSGQQKNDS